jgi:predicted ATPase/DNA-binding SARP family transcriptional activator
MEILLLGPVEVRDGDRVHRPAGKQAVLLAALAREPGQTVTRERLIDELWPGDPPETAAKSIDVYLWRLRRAIPGLDLEKRGGGYRLVASREAVDVYRFRDLVERGRAAVAAGEPAAGAELLADALDLWRGPALTGIDGVGGAQLDELRLAAQEDRIAAELETGNDARLAAELESLVLAHPLRERLRALLMLALYRSGRQADALGAYKQAREAFVEELGIEPTPALQRLEQSILRQDPKLELPNTEPTEPFASARSGPRGASLPAESTTLVGRQHELDRIARLLASPTPRLVTLTGTGGSGKSRLALRAAAQQQTAFPGRVFMIALAPVAGPELVIPAIAEALGVPETGGRSLLDSLATHLAHRDTLLVLDNFEHVLDAAADVSALLAACPPLRIIATSRVPLRVKAEHEFEVPPLERDPAVELFAERAREIRHDFTVGSANAGHVAQLCARLDGLPLAIELAAARVRLLTPEAMLARMEHRLDLLTTGASDAPLRHRTLRDSIAWSFSLLEPGQQLLFTRLAVFRGGWRLDGAEAVSAGDVLDDLTVLVEHSLVQMRFGADGEPRFDMLETIAEFAREQLAASEELGEIQRRHAWYFVGLAESIEPWLYTGQRAPSQRRLSEERDNLRAVMAWSAENDIAEPALRILAALWQWYWLSLGEGAATGERILALPSAAPRTAVRAGALFTTALASWGLGLIEPAVRLAGEELVIAQQLGDDLLLARGLMMRAAVEEMSDEERRTSCLEALESVRRTGDSWQEAWIEMTCAMDGMYSSDPAFGEEHGERAVAQFRELDDAWSWAVPGVPLGYSRLQLGKLEEATEILEECLPVLLDVGDLKIGNICAIGLAMVARFSGDLDSAGRHYEHALALCIDAGDPAHTPLCLEGMAAARGPSDPAEAARLLGRASALYDAGHRPWIPGFEIFYPQTLEAVTEGCGNGFDELFEAGRAEAARGGIEPSLSGSALG